MNWVTGTGRATHDSRWRGTLIMLLAGGAYEIVSVIGVIAVCIYACADRH